MVATHGLVTGTRAQPNHGVCGTVVVAGLIPFISSLYDTDIVRRRCTQYGFFRTHLISLKPFRSIEDDRPVRKYWLSTVFSWGQNVPQYEHIL